MELFSGREGICTRQVRRDNGTVVYEQLNQPLSEDLWRRHLKGELTLGLFLLRNNLTVKLMVIDIDIVKKELMQTEPDSEERQHLMRLAHRDALRLVETAREYGIAGYIEDSGNRGRHCWFFFSEAVLSTRARELAHFLAVRTGEPSAGITWEVFFPVRCASGPGRTVP